MMTEIRSKHYWEIPAMCDFLHLFLTISYQQSSPPLRFAHKSQGMNLFRGVHTSTYLHAFTT